MEPPSDLILARRRFKNATRFILFCVPVILSACMHWYVFSLDVMGIHVWRQAQTQSTIYLFSFSENTIFCPQKFDLKSGSSVLLYEFPLYQWLIAQVNNVAGYAVTHSRYFSFLCFVLFLVGFYRFCRIYFNQKEALLTHCLLCFSPLLYYYCVIPLPDILALTLSVWGLHLSLNNGKLWKLLFAIILFGFASLVKLPYVLFATALLFRWIMYARAGQKRELWISAMMFLIVFINPIGWYMKAIPTWKGNDITRGLFANNKSVVELLDIIWFHVISTLPELITNYASTPLLLLGLGSVFKNRHWVWKRHKVLTTIFLLYCGYFVFELHMIEKTHEYYMLPFVPLVFLVVALGIRMVYQSRYRWILVLILLITPLTAWLRIDHRWDPESPGFPSGLLQEQEQLQAIIPSQEKCIVYPDNSGFIALYYLKRFGYSLAEGEASEDVFKQYNISGAGYLILPDPEKTFHLPEKEFQLIHDGKVQVLKFVNR